MGNSRQRAGVGTWLPAGVLAGLGCLAVALALRLVAPWPSYFDLAGDRLTLAMPGVAFDLLLERLQHWGKPVLLIGLCSLSLALLGLAGWVYGRIAARLAGTGARWAAALALGLALWASDGWLVGAFTLAAPSNLEALGAAVPAFAVFAAILAVLGPGLPSQAASAAPDRARRRLLSGLASFAVLLNGGILWRLVIQMLEPAASSGHAAGRTSAPAEPEASSGAAAPATEAVPDLFASLSETTPRITDNDVFYRISKNFVDPTVAVDSWSLDVFGLVEQARRLSYEQVRALPVVEEQVTLECISNLVGGPLAGNAVWTGVRLSTVLAAARVKPEAKFVLFTCSDNYTESYPLDKALADSTILAYAMNGHPLPRRHGFPLRVISTGRYGMKNPKWLRKIELAATEQPGHWERQGWDQQAVVQTMSRIDLPAAGIPLSAGSAFLGGVAFAGDRGISKVEVSVDGGSSWQSAVREQPQALAMWTRWVYPWPDAALGRYRAVVRATDGTGALQTPERRASLPTGARGYDEVDAIVR